MWPAAAQRDPLVTRPYLQLGARFAQGNMEVVWHAAPSHAGWRVFWRKLGETGWRESSSISRRPAIDREVWAAEIPVGRNGEAFEYQLRLGDVVQSIGRGRAPAPPGQRVTFAVTGDVGDGTDGQRAAVARLLEYHRGQPIQFGLIAGDIAYECGRRDEYSAKFYPMFNPMSGDSLMADVPIAVAPGNHDVGDLRWPLPPFRCSSDYSHFYFWRHPSGFPGPIPIGPRHNPKSPSAPLQGVEKDLRRVLASANYSFTWGDAHVTVIDSNRYVNWADASMLRWLEADLAGASQSRWRFVLMHHPPFNVSRHHRGDQWSRYFAPLFERYGVTAVFSGHVHNFQWFGPLRFTPEPAELGRFAAGARGSFSGTLEVQADYDGVSRTAARWPVYVVSGAGGGALVAEGGGCPPDVRAPRGCGEPPPADGQAPSVSFVDVGADAVVIRQVNALGRILHERRITRQSSAR